MSLSASCFGIPTNDLDHILNSVGNKWENLKGATILLTGGTGFIGKWILDSFLYANKNCNLNAKIIVISRNPEKFSRVYPAIAGYSEIEWFAGDIIELPKGNFPVCKFAIHAATDVVIKNSPDVILKTSLLGTQNVLDAISNEKEHCRLLYISSGAVYGDIPASVEKISEEWAGAPSLFTSKSAYGEGKRIGELLCQAAVEEREGLEVSIARCFAFVGPHLPLDKQFAIGNFIRSALLNETIQINGDGSPLRSYLYIADLIHWLWVMLFEGENCRPYNVGGDEIISIKDLAYKVNEVLNCSLDVELGQSTKPNASSNRYVPSLNRIKEELNLSPSFDLDTSITRTAKWAKTII